MNPAPVGSFVRFLVGFLTFISVSLGITVAVNSYTISKEKASQQAAAFKAVIVREE